MSKPRPLPPSHAESVNLRERIISAIESALATAGFVFNHIDSGELRYEAANIVRYWADAEDERYHHSKAESSAVPMPSEEPESGEAVLEAFLLDTEPAPPGQANGEHGK